MDRLRRRSRVGHRPGRPGARAVLIVEAIATASWVASRASDSSPSIARAMLLASAGRRAEDGSVAVDWHERIIRDPRVRSGQPTIRGMRVTVKDVLELLAGGMTIAEIVRDFPYIEEADVLAVLAFAAENLEVAKA
jgi:uncharacterized protein (DUF433 family)